MIGWQYMDEWKLERALERQAPRDMIRTLKNLPINAIGNNCMEIVDNLTDRHIDWALQALHNT